MIKRQKDEIRDNARILAQIEAETCDIHWERIIKLILDKSMDKCMEFHNISPGSKVVGIITIASDQNVGTARYERRRRGPGLAGDCLDCLYHEVMES